MKDYTNSKKFLFKFEKMRFFIIPFEKNIYIYKPVNKK
ncbi:unnamed protein product [Brassica napus]|uniref:(rape) hypothetical protein n=1 Tax=Brassica napus TaxID=3708 RepID=A0A816J3H9_BRANA|nr:unnamed protein product [Brassica napus]